MSMLDTAYLLGNLVRGAPDFRNVYVDTGGQSRNRGVDLDQLVEQSRQRRAAAEQQRQNAEITRGAVDRRRQELREQGALGFENVGNALAASNAIGNRLNSDQRLALGPLGWHQGGIQAKALPGIGTSLNVTTPTGPGNVVIGRYGTGIATNRANPDRMIEGIPASQWFAEQAAKQGVSNKFATASPTGITDKQDPYGIQPRFVGKAIVTKAMNKRS